MLNLALFAGKQVLVTFENGTNEVGTIVIDFLGRYSELYGFRSNSGEVYYGKYNWCGSQTMPTPGQRIIDIEELKPVDLSEFLNKKVRVTFWDGRVVDGEISSASPRAGNKANTHPYFLQNDLGNGTGAFTKEGYYYTSPCIVGQLNIVKIEPIGQVDEIDLSQFVGKEVSVVYRNGETGKVTIRNNTIPGYPYVTQESMYTARGTAYSNPDAEHPYDILEIELCNPMIDLSKFVDKCVRVTYRSGEEAEVIICSNTIPNMPSYPYRIHGVATYGGNGRVYGDSSKAEHQHDILKIELLDSGDTVEYLESRVAILQREIDTANAEIKRIKNEKKVIAEQGDWKVEKCGDNISISFQGSVITDMKYKNFMGIVEQCSSLLIDLE